MKLSKKHLRNIIQEELQAMLSEQSPPLSDKGPWPVPAAQYQMQHARQNPAALSDKSAWPVPDHIYQQQADRMENEAMAREDMLRHANDPFSPYHEMAVSALKAEIPSMAQEVPRQEIAPMGAPNIHDYHNLGTADEINRQEFGESFPYDIGKAAVALDYKQTFDKCVKANNGDLKPCIR